MKSVVLVGANIKLFINNKVYAPVQAISLDIDYAEEVIYGIDSPWPQEIAGGKVTIRGSVQGLRIKDSKGLQAQNDGIRPLFSDLAASPYISIRIQDISTNEDIVFIPRAKITRETHSTSIKSSYKLNFDFVGQIIKFPLDRV